MRKGYGQRATSCPLGIPKHIEDLDGQDPFQPCLRDQGGDPIENKTLVPPHGKLWWRQQLRVVKDKPRPTKGNSGMNIDKNGYIPTMDRPNYNTWVHDKFFKFGDLMLHWVEVSQSSSQGELSLNWEGPYWVEEVIQLGMTYLMQLDGIPLPRP